MTRRELSGLHQPLEKEPRSYSIRHLWRGRRLTSHCMAPKAGTESQAPCCQLPLCPKTSPLLTILKVSIFTLIHSHTVFFLNSVIPYTLTSRFALGIYAQHSTLACPQPSVELEEKPWEHTCSHMWGEGMHVYLCTHRCLNHTCVCAHISPVCMLDTY